MPRRSVRRFFWRWKGGPGRANRIVETNGKRQGRLAQLSQNRRYGHGPAERTRARLDGRLSGSSGLRWEQSTCAPGDEHPQVCRLADTAAFARCIDAAGGSASAVAAEIAALFGKASWRQPDPVHVSAHRLQA